MRTIKFKGKRIDNGKWIYGFFIEDPTGQGRIYWKPFDEATSNTYHFVHPETVGQFVIHNTQNNQDAFEGDYCLIEGVKWSVEYHEDLCKWVLTNGNGYDTKNCIDLTCDSVFDLNFIGNIHDTTSNEVNR